MPLLVGLKAKLGVLVRRFSLASFTEKLLGQGDGPDFPENNGG
jgi:hypothetical protein